MASELFLLPFRPAFDANGIVVPGAQLFFYATETTMPQAVFSDSGLEVPLANPVEANAAGVWPAIYLNDALTYRVVLKDADGATLSDADPYLPGVVDNLAADVAADAAAAAASAAEAELFALAIQLLGAGIIYDTDADGVDPTTGVADGEFFVTWEDARVRLYLNDGGAAVEKAEFATAAFLDQSYAQLTDLPVNARAYGAVGDGVTLGQEAAINDALATGKDVRINPGTFMLSDAIVSTTPGQVIRGAGKHLTVLKVPATFNLSADGVLVGEGLQPGLEVCDLTIEFVQPDTAVRANLIAYPPAINIKDAPRSRLRNLRIERAMTAVDMRGNSGGTNTDDLEIASFDWAVRIDGALDSVRLNDLHHWPFDLTANQMSIFFDDDNVGIESGRMDDLHIVAPLLIGGGKQMHFINTGAGATFGNITNAGFDTFASLVVEDGYISVSDSQFTIGGPAGQAIKQTGGNLRIGNTQFQCDTALTLAMIEVLGNAYFKMTNSDAYVPGDMEVVKLSATSGNATGIITGNQFILPQNTSPTKAVVNAAAGGRITFNDNRANDKGTGTGNLLDIAADDFHQVKDNAFMGWGVDLPASWSSADIGGNSSIAQGDVPYGRLVGKLSHIYLTGTASGAGAVNIAHSLSNAQFKVLSASVGYKGGAGEWVPCSVTVDGTNAIVTGAGASAPVRVWLTYTETQHAW